MSFDLDTKVDLARAKTVTLAGREFKVAPLTLRNIIAASEMQTKFLQSDGAGQHITNLIEFVLLGLRRTYPNITADDLLESEITIGELNAAMAVVIEQAGGAKVGEQMATAQSGLGAGSSPSSALN